MTRRIQRVMTQIAMIQFITTKANFGRGANDGIYYPVGLCCIASAINKVRPDIQLVIDDEHHNEVWIRPEASLVAIQVASTLCHERALRLAEEAKAKGKLVVLGGPHVSDLYQQVMKNRPYVDFVIRGKGEQPTIALIEALEGRRKMEKVPSLSWRGRRNEIVHNQLLGTHWRYDDYAPLPLHLLSSGLPRYWQAFRATTKRPMDAAFVINTHFDCGYRVRVNHGREGLKHCSFCRSYDSRQDVVEKLDFRSLAGARNPQLILREIQFYLQTHRVPKGARVHLKCYGDNAGSQKPLIKALRYAIEHSDWWPDYDISWTFYCQSSELTEELAQDFKAIGTSHMFIGFDSINDAVQKANHLGTNRKTHEQASRLCQRYGILIQAGSVVGLDGETPQTLQENYQFYRQLSEQGAIDRINSAQIFVIPGTAIYERLAEHQPWIRELDVLPTQKLRQLWIRHRCPKVSLELLEEYANKIDALSPVVHASMGFESRLIAQP